jgi:hypothetical protein
VEDDDDYLKRPSHKIANVSSFLEDKIAGMTRLVRDVVVKCCRPSPYESLKYMQVVQTQKENV